jgi:RNA polymerase sigma factor (sigma-70 family)
MLYTDTSLLLKKNKDEGITVLYNRYGKKLYTYAIKNWNLDEDQSWDVVYRTIYQVVSAIDKYEFENESKFSGFVFKIFINYLRNHYRDEKRRKEQLSFTALGENHLNHNGSAMEPQNEDTKDSQSMQLLKAELEKLEDWERILLLLRGQNVAYSEIAKHIDKPEEQLKVYYQRLKNKMMERLKNKIVITTK